MPDIKTVQRGNPSLVYMILGFLYISDSHAYDLLKKLKETFKEIWRPSQSQIYVVLSKLEKNQYILSKVIDQENRPPKKHFTITEKGKELFLKWLKSPTIHVKDMKSDFMAKLFFLSVIFPKNINFYLEKQANHLNILLEKLTFSKGKSNNFFAELVLSYKIHLITSWIEWLNMVQTELPQIVNKTDSK